jgi:hypothetical protein
MIGACQIQLPTSATTDVLGVAAQSLKARVPASVQTKTMQLPTAIIDNGNNVSGPRITTKKYTEWVRNNVTAITE